MGTFVTITGAGFAPGATSVGFNGTAAIVRTVTATTITTIVPVGATSGALTVTTTRGMVSRSFEASLRRDFALVAEPASVPAVVGTSVSVAVRPSATGEVTDLIELATGPLPAGVTAGFSPPVATAEAPSVLTLTVSDTAAAGSSAVEIRATARVDGVAVVRTASITLEVQPPGQTVLIGQVRDRSERPLAGVRILQGGSFTPLGRATRAGTSSSRSA